MVLVPFGLLPHAVVPSLETGDDGVVDVSLRAVDLSPLSAFQSSKTKGEAVACVDDPLRHPRDGALRAPSAAECEKGQE